jgi:hypothetical protein
MHYGDRRLQRVADRPSAQINLETGPIGPVSARGAGPLTGTADV